MVYLCIMQKYDVFVISGGTGFIGSHLVRNLLAQGKKVYILTRSSKKSSDDNLVYLRWDIENKFFEAKILEQNVCVIHLAGASVAGGRWTNAYLDQIVKSRTQGTKFLWDLINNGSIPASYFIGASATGYYGESKNEKAFVETDVPANDFLGKTCVAWEQAVVDNNSKKIPSSLFRLGMVLGLEGGAVPQFIRTLPLGIAGIPGSGKQIYPWIHVEDVVEAMLQVAAENITGTYNLVSPEPASARQIITALAKARGGFFIAIPSPSIIIKLLLGKFSTEVLKSVLVSSAKLQSRYTFRYANLDNACKEIMQKKTT